MMRRVFADTNYWLAIGWPQDPWRGAAEKARAALDSAKLVTTEEVLIECLNAFSGNPLLRQKMALIIRRISKSPDVEVVPQSHHSFQRGLSLYEMRNDKCYSLTDCISMSLMREKGIRDALTNDHHFEQEGFRALMKG